MKKFKIRLAVGADKLAFFSVPDHILSKADKIIHTWGDGNTSAFYAFDEKCLALRASGKVGLSRKACYYYAYVAVGDTLWQCDKYEGPQREDIRQKLKHITLEAFTRFIKAVTEVPCGLDMIESESEAILEQQRVKRYTAPEKRVVRKNTAGLGIVWLKKGSTECYTIPLSDSQFSRLEYRRIGDFACYFAVEFEFVLDGENKMRVRRTKGTENATVCYVRVGQSALILIGTGYTCQNYCSEESSTTVAAGIEYVEQCIARGDLTVRVVEDYMRKYPEICS